VTASTKYRDLPQDFHAVMEAFLADRWYLLDPTGLAKLSDCVRIGTGSDASDAPFATLFWLRSPGAPQSTGGAGNGTRDSRKSAISRLRYPAPTGYNTQRPGELSQPASDMMRASVTGVRSELGSILLPRLAMAATKHVHINIAGQQANSLLHDGHAWKDFPRTALAGTRRAMRLSRTDGASMLVHASFAFVHAVERGAVLTAPWRSAVDAILECEALALSGSVSACVVRLGYLYGPTSADLLAYRTAFHLGRPYWSGPRKARQYHLHQLDAASALLAAARPLNAGKILYATDGHAISFAQFMDAFAHRVGRRTPLHLPSCSKLLARVIIREEHMQQTALPMPSGTPTPRVKGWKPKFADYRDGLDQVIRTWGN